MFEKVVTDKTVEDENSVIVLRKYWRLWYLLAFSPWSSCLPKLIHLSHLHPSVSLCGFGCTVSGDGLSLSPPSLGFTNSCPYFLLLSYQMALSEYLVGISTQHI